MAHVVQTPPPPIPAGIPDHIDPVRAYRVQLLTAVAVGSITLTPAQQHTMTGAVLEQVKGSVYGAVAA